MSKDKHLQPHTPNVVTYLKKVVTDGSSQYADEKMPFEETNSC